jgi:hypothetical protein
LLLFSASYPLILKGINTLRLFLGFEKLQNWLTLAEVQQVLFIKLLGNRAKK